MDLDRLRLPQAEQNPDIVLQFISCSLPAKAKARPIRESWPLIQRDLTSVSKIAKFLMIRDSGRVELSTFRFRQSCLVDRSSNPSKNVLSAKISSAVITTPRVPLHEVETRYQLAGILVLRFITLCCAGLEFSPHKRKGNLELFLQSEPFIAIYTYRIRDHGGKGIIPPSSAPPCPQCEEDVPDTRIDIEKGIHDAIVIRFGRVATYLPVLTRLPSWTLSSEDVKRSTEDFSDSFQGFDISTVVTLAFYCLVRRGYKMDAHMVKQNAILAKIVHGRDCIGLNVLPLLVTRAMDKSLSARDSKKTTIPVYVFVHSLEANNPTFKWAVFPTGSKKLRTVGTKE
ncbi:hypothetical protein BDN72DRAFT_861069 [Pluteus cervinus]|uniref:Uncharacterized protein n=1 Tax=Pluteus cervinus TaxID=181527 RepID=A0ACD3AGR1_9AGAR|nr:hypothetical protein BDN72DRAFT_861069 [Pluteus cervinus]